MKSIMSVAFAIGLAFAVSLPTDARAKEAENYLIGASILTVLAVAATLPSRSSSLSSPDDTLLSFAPDERQAHPLVEIAPAYDTESKAVWARGRIRF